MAPFHKRQSHLTELLTESRVDFKSGKVQVVGPRLVRLCPRNLMQRDLVATNTTGSQIGLLFTSIAQEIFEIQVFRHLGVLVLHKQLQHLPRYLYILE